MKIDIPKQCTTQKFKPNYNNHAIVEKARMLDFAKKQNLPKLYLDVQIELETDFKLYDLDEEIINKIKTIRYQ